MNSELAALINDAKEWLKGQPSAEPQSERWFSLGSFRAFIGQIESNPSAQSIEKAEWALGWHISDQQEWSAPYRKDISAFRDRAARIRKGMKNG